MKYRIYTDTSVLGGCEDEEFAEHSIRLLESFVRGERVLVLSSLTVQELGAAPVAVRTRLASVPEGHIETLQLGVEALELAEAYLSAGVLPRRLDNRSNARFTAPASRSKVPSRNPWGAMCPRST